MSFSVRRFEVVMRTLTPKQIGFLVKYGYDLILELKHKVVFPMVLIDWVMDNMVPELAMFRYEHKRIYFDKYMIQQFIGIPSGDTIAKMSSKDLVIVDKVNLLKVKYMGTGNKIYMKTVIDQLKGDEDEESFMRTFMLVLLGTILCPSTSDTVDWRFLYSLTDLTMMISVDWATLCLQVLLNEVGNFKNKMLKFPNGMPTAPIYVGGCLPSLAVVYMDFLELNPRSIQYSIDYGVPRIFHVNNADFKLVTQFDRIQSSGRFVFGAIDFREKSCTPYSNREFKEFLEKQSKRQHLPPPAETPSQPPPAETHYQPPSTEMHSQPPTSETHFQPPTGYAVNKCTDLVEHTFVGDAKVGASFANDVDNYEGTTSNIVSSPRQEHAASDHDHFMDQHEDTVVKSSHCNELVIEQNKAPTDSNVTGDKRNCDAGTSSPQEDFPSDLVMKIHNEPILDKDKSKSDISATIDIRDAKHVHSLDPKQSPPANLIIPNQDSVVSISSAADFSHPHYDESATSRDSVIKANTLLDDASASTPQEDFPSDLVIKTHHEPILDKDKSKSDTSATIEIRGAIPIHSLDPEQSPSANLIIPNQDTVVSISSAADFSHPHYDKSATSRDSVIKAKTLLDDASASPKHVLFKDSGLSITDVAYISSQEQEVDHSVENVARQFDGVCISTSQQEYYVAIKHEHISQHSKCIDAIGDVASTPPSSSPKGEAHSDTIKSVAKDCDETDVNRGIDIAMSYASEDPQSPFSNAHTPLSSSAEVQSDDVSNTGPSTIDKRKRKKINAKKPCHFEERLNLFVDDSAEIFYDKYLGNMLFKNSKKSRETNIVVDLNGHTVTYERFYQSLKPRGEIANEVMDAFVQLFNERNDKVKDDKSSLRKISFSPFFMSKLNVPPEKFTAKSVSREIVKMKKKFNFAKCDLLHFLLVHDHHWTITSINLLFKKINFLDSLQDNNKEKKVASNMVLISKVRKVVAHGLVSSTMNDMTTKVNNFKKQRLS
ncbi:hypothetical protein ACQ4PT_007794 [Festuca glaucescens]